MAGLYSSSITKARIIYAILLVLVVAGVSATKNLHAAAPPLELDGVGTNDCQIHLFCRSQSLTTSTGHDVIILIVETNSNITRVLDSSGLVFTQRVSYGIPRLWEYYARATSPLRSDNITIATNADCCYHTVIGMQAIAVRGSNTEAIFDPNPSIPALVSCSFQSNAYVCESPGYGECLANGFGTCSASIQTSTFDFVIAVTAINDAPSCGLGYPNGIVPGFTNLTNWFNRFEIDYVITIEPQTTVAFDCNGTDAMTIVIDAISFHGAFANS